MNNMTGKTIYHYNYCFNDGSKDRAYANRYTKAKREVLLESDTEVVINGGFGFEVLFKNHPHVSGINEPSVVIDIGCNTWGNGVIFNLYSTTELADKVIRTLIINEIKTKLHFLGLTGLQNIKSKISEVVK